MTIYLRDTRGALYHHKNCIFVFLILVSREKNLYPLLQQVSQSEADRDVTTVDVFVGDNVDVTTELTIMLYSQAPPHSVTVNNGQTSTQPILVAGTAYRIKQYFRVSPAGVV